MTTTRPKASPSGLGLIDDLVMSYRGAHALMAAVSLGVFDALVGEPQSASRVAQEIGAASRSTEILLDALVALGFLEKEGGLYRNTPVAEQHLTTGGDGALVHNLQYQQLLAEAWSRLPQVVRTGEPAVSLPTLLAGNPEFVERYILGMADISRRPARELTEQLDFTTVRTILDVGGASGVYSEALLDRLPHGARAVVLDLGPTLRIADKRLLDSIHRARIELREGDYHTAPFGREEFDLVLFSHVLHDEGEDEAKLLLNKAFGALKKGGQVVIHDFMPVADRTGPLFPALFSLHMLVYTRKGRAYSADEYEAWLKGCGYTEPHRATICADRPTATTAVIARKP